MCRLAPLSLALLLSILLPGGAAARLIDNFESGYFSLSRSEMGNDSSIQTPDPGHCIATQRQVVIGHYGGFPAGTMTSQLVPLQNVDDAVVTTFPENIDGGQLDLYWSGGPWDLTEGGYLNRLTVRVEGGGGGTILFVRLDDTNSEDHTMSAVVSGSGLYKFSLWDFDFVDPTQIESILIQVYGPPGVTVGIENIETSSGSTTTMIYRAWEPRIISLLCGPRGEGQTVGWDWAIGWPSQPQLAGPQLQVQGISGQGCAGVELEAQDSGDGGFGEVGLITVDWQAATFDNGIFELAFVTDPNAGYVASLAVDPVVDFRSNGFSIVHEIDVQDAFGIPDGRVRQELVVAPVPGQEIWLDYVDAIPIEGSSGVGYSLSFAYTGSLFDSGLPLLEIYTSSSFGDDQGVTDVATRVGGAPSGSLRALPSVTRTGTRFVLSGERETAGPIDIYDVTGRLVRSLESRDGEAAWDATDSRGARVPAGVYFGRAEGVPRAARVVLLR